MLTGNDGLNTKVINNLSREICGLWENGIEVILVSSGAISSGLKKLGLTEAESISKKQAPAAVGQAVLMMAYEKAFARYGKMVAQILITRDDFNNRRRYLNARNTILTLLSWGIVPVINENDTVCRGRDQVRRQRQPERHGHQPHRGPAPGQPDRHGRTLRQGPQHEQEDARLINVVEKISSDVVRHAGTEPGALGTGGMASKIKAAQEGDALAGMPTIIANGRRQGVLEDIFRGEEMGTLFLPQEIPSATASTG